MGVSASIPTPGSLMKPPKQLPEEAATGLVSSGYGKRRSGETPDHQDRVEFREKAAAAAHSPMREGMAAAHVP